MNGAEMNYPTHERELLVVIHALRTWRHYLLGKQFKIVIDHHSLKYLITQPNLSKRQARWVDMLAGFDFVVVHRLRKSNVVADALSRLHAVQHPGDTMGKTCSRDWNRHIKKKKK